MKVTIFFLKSVGWKRPNKQKFITSERLLDIFKALVCFLATMNSLCTKNTEQCTLLLYNRNLVLTSLLKFIGFPSNRNLTTKVVF